MYNDFQSANFQPQGINPQHQAQGGTCPNCGYCPHCGRGYQTQPWPYIQPYYPTMPYQWPNIIWGGSNLTGLQGYGGIQSQ